MASEHEKIQLFEDYERVGVPGRHRDFNSYDAGFGTLSERMAAYDNGREGVTEFLVTFVSAKTPVEVVIPTEESPAGALAVIGNEKKSRAVIQEAIIRYFVG